MITRRVRIQLTIFVIAALLGISYVGAKYAGLDSMFGASGYVVKVRLADSGGIFSNAEVTYRGVAIGRVSELHLVNDGVEVDLRIDDDAPRVPADVDAVVANRSAVGEQYLDLRPRRDGEPYLADGSVISKDATSLPLANEKLVLNLDKLVASVPNDDLRKVVDELYLATQGTGPSLQVLLDSANSFTKLATENLPQTLQLITDSGTVLATQVEVSQAIQNFGVNAKLIAEQLAKSDGDIRSILSNAPGAAEQINGLLAESGKPLSVVLANLLTTSNVLVTRQAGIEQLLVVAPKGIAAASDVFTDQGARFGLQTTFFDPLPCTVGYEGTQRRNGLDTSPAPLNTNARCALAPGSGNVRGSQNAPNGGVPPAVRPADFGAVATPEQQGTAPGGSGELSRSLDQLLALNP
ncbi:MCE family protein [Actinokineospora bangkokensis]|uniref:ABC transporter substrate-binding protein n=1 Tax=Actinokineospora bangkokensis TaxID=1193682 RepID=A0A1Q9LJB1_9PSEU|nr:MlaD family protein [Actinokineospora bangkokensis]OLR92093.1 ABC transporter substrate-binding protein [Actinokineospora bangkokensis]